MDNKERLQLKEKYQREIEADLNSYKAVMSGEMKALKSTVWATPWALLSSAEITKYMLNDIAHFNVDEIPSKVKYSTFRSTKLVGMLHMLFEDKLYNAIDNAYPGKWNEYDMTRLPRHHWDKESNLQAFLVREIESKIGKDIKKLREKFTIGFLRTNCRSVNCKSGYTLAELLDVAYPGEFQPWELHTPEGYWESEYNVKKAIRWLVDTKLDGSKERVMKEFTLNLLDDNGLKNILIASRYNTLYDLIDITYPGEYNPWDMPKVSRGFWKKTENIDKALLYLYRDVYDSDMNYLMENITAGLLRQIGMNTLLTRFHGNMTEIKERIQCLVYASRPKRHTIQQANSVHKSGTDSNRIIDAQVHKTVSM